MSRSESQDKPPRRPPAASPPIQPREGPPAAPPPRADAIVCPICGVAGVEKLEKWFCPRCKMLLRTCCD
jgi:hypothetical protein